MKRSILLLSAAILLLPWAALGAGDTGTYRIESYRVDLTPHSDGTVDVRYYMKWLVTGGHIPWIAVGTPNADFRTGEYGGAATVVTPENQGGWSGVRLDLDRDYREGDEFEVTFAIVQRKLFYADKESYRLDFTPGWYDRARIDTLRIGMKFFADISNVSADPAPSVVSGDEMLWTAYALSPGERFTVRVSFPMGLVRGGIEKSNLKGGASKGIAVVVVVVIVLGMIVIFSAMRSAARWDKGRYSGGRIFYGGFPGGVVRGGRSGGGRSTGGGGGFGGSSISCACACVSCACACACAGGGGAGCSRKLEHVCPACRAEEHR